MTSHSIGFDGVGVHENTADTISGDIEGHSDVTLFSPGSSPGVSDDEILLTVVTSVTNSGNGVIEVVTAFLGVEDTSGVTLEVVVGSINRDASWSSGDGGFKGGDALRFDGFVGLNVDLTF